MPTSFLPTPVPSLATLATAALLTACADLPTSAPSSKATPSPAVASARREYGAALAELRRVTARYHDVDAALADGFVPVTPGCAEEEGGAVMPIPYAHLGRLTDGRIDPSLPDALLYEPTGNGKFRLVGVELAIPYPQWTDPQPPTFLGVAFQEEDALGVWGLHIWVWGTNPEGMFAEENPRITCDPA